MNRTITVGLAMLVGGMIGGVGVNQLSAQNKAPGAYVVADITAIPDMDAYKTMFPEVERATKEHGGTFIIRTEKITALDGTPPKRFAVISFDSMAKATAWHNSAEMKEADSIRAKTSTSRSFLVEGSQ